MPACTKTQTITYPYLLAFVFSVMKFNCTDSRTFFKTNDSIVENFPREIFKSLGLR